MRIRRIILISCRRSTVLRSGAGFDHNMVPVTLGNIVGRAVFVGGAYWLSAAQIRLPGPAAATAPASPAIVPD